MWFSLGDPSEELEVAKSRSEAKFVSGMVRSERS